MKTERLASPCEHASGAVRHVGFINSKRVGILSFADMQIKIDCYMVFRKIFGTYLRKHSSSGGGGGGRGGKRTFCARIFGQKNDNPPPPP